MNSFDEIEKKLEASRKKVEAAIQAGVTVDVGVRLGMIAAACTLTKNQIDKYLNSFKDQLLDQYEDEDSLKIAEETFERLRKGVHLLNEVKL